MIEIRDADVDPAARGRLLDVLARAFLENPMNRVLHSANPRRRLRANRAGLRHVVVDPAVGAGVRVATIGGEVVGGYVVVTPGAFPLPRVRFVRMLECLVHQGPQGVLGWGEVNHDLLAVHPTFPHWYLCVLGVAPEMWGRGVGSALVEDLGRVARTDPAPIYLESDRPESIAFYRSRGFLMRDARTVHGVRCVCLERPATGE